MDHQNTVCQQQELKLGPLADITRSTESFNNLSKCDITADSNTSFEVKDSNNNKYIVKLNKSFSPMASPSERHQVGIPKPGHYLMPEWHQLNQSQSP